MSELLPFPTRNKGRVRKSRSQEAMGRCSLSLMEREGERPPENVTDIRIGRETATIDEGRLAFRLASALFAVLTAEQKDRVRQAIRSMARHDDGPCGDECRALDLLLTSEARPC